MLAKDRCLKKQINLRISIVFVLVIFFSSNLIGSQINDEIAKYLKNMNSFSSKFIQSSGFSIEEGYIYIEDDKIRIDYFNPSRTLKVNRVKGVYINHELREEEFFSVEKSVISIFYNIFLDNSFFSSLKLKEDKKQIVFEKNIIIDSKKTNLKIYFENNPLLLRKIITETEEEFMSFSLNEHNYNEVFEKDFFSFVPIYLD